MASSDKPILSDPMITPDHALLKTILGDKMGWWDTIMDHTIANYPSVTPVWKYYNDGKQWLFRLMKKKDTLFWTSLVEDTFRITFYFPDRAEQLIEASNLPARMKEEFVNGRRYGRIRGLTVRMESEEDLDKVRELIGIKFQVK